MPKQFTITCLEVDGRYPNTNPIYTISLTLEQIRRLRTCDFDYAMSSIRGGEGPLIGPHGFTGAVNDFYSKLHNAFPDIDNGLGYKLCGQGERSGDIRGLLQQSKGLFRRLLGIACAAAQFSEPQLNAMQAEDSKEQDAERARRAAEQIKQQTQLTAEQQAREAAADYARRQAETQARLAAEQEAREAVERAIKAREAAEQQARLQAAEQAKLAAVQQAKDAAERAQLAAAETRLTAFVTQTKEATEQTGRIVEQQTRDLSERERQAELEQQKRADEKQARFISEQQETCNEAMKAAIVAEDLIALVQSLDAGSEVNAQGVNGVTALHMAVIRTNPDMVELLLQRGANPTATWGALGTPLDLIKMSSAYRQGLSQASLIAEILANGLEDVQSERLSMRCQRLRLVSVLPALSLFSPPSASLSQEFEDQDSPCTSYTGGSL